LIGCLSHWDLPNHGNPHRALKFVGKSLMNRGATRCFCNVQLYYAKVITYWTIIENSMKSKLKFSGELGCTFGILESVQWLEFYEVDFIIFRPNMSAIKILFTLGAITWSCSHYLNQLQIGYIGLPIKQVCLVCLSPWNFPNLGTFYCVLGTIGEPWMKKSH
jgi:hypothetical protein